MFKSIYLAQSDTTAGFFCVDSLRLNAIKGRKAQQNVLLVLDSLMKLKDLVRVPNCHKNRVRKSSRSTFIYKGKNALNQESLAVRLVCPSSNTKIGHSDFLSFFPYLYSSSANAHKAGFSLDFALDSAEVVILDARLLSANTPSKMYKITNTNIKRLR